MFYKKAACIGIASFSVAAVADELAVVSAPGGAGLTYDLGCASTGLSGAANVSESTAFRMVGGFLRQDTVSNPSSVVAATYSGGDVDGGLAWTLEARVRQVAVEPDATPPIHNDIIGFGLKVVSSGLRFSFWLGNGAAYGNQSGGGPGVPSSIDDGQFHTYTLTHHPSSATYRAYEDGNLLFEQQGASSSESPHMQFGDSTCHGGNAVFDIDYVSFTQDGTLETILLTFDGAVSTGTLHGVGPGNSARLSALRASIALIGDMVAGGDQVETCMQIAFAQERIDGLPSPTDFADGSAAPTLHGLLDDLAAEHGC